MKLVIPVILSLLIPSSFQLNTSERGWRGIVPLHSTHADVEKLLGPPSRTESPGSYYSDDFNALFSYTSGNCEDGRSADWNVPVGTVIKFSIVLKPHPKLSDLKIDEKQFEIREELGSMLAYINREQGILLEVQQGLVTGMYYGPGTRDEYLRCPEYDGISYTASLPKEQRPRIRERLNQFVEYSHTGQFEKQYELYLPEFAAQMSGTRDKHKYARMVRDGGPIDGIFLNFELKNVGETEDSTYGKVYEVFGLAKIAKDRKIEESYRETKLLFRNGEWYFIDFFKLIPQ